MSPKPRRFKSHGSRYRPEGTIHWAVYSPENKVWYVACRKPYNDPFGKMLPEYSDLPITCKTCIKQLGRGIP